MTSEHTPMPCSSGQTEFTSLEQSRLKRRHRWFSSQRHKTTTTRELFIWGCSLITQKISGQSLLLGMFAAFYVISQSPLKKKPSVAILSTPSHTHPSNTFHLLTVRVDEPHQKQGAMKSGLITPIQEQTQESLQHVVSGSSARQDYCPLRRPKTRPIPSSPLSWQFAALCLPFLWSLGIKEQPLWAVSD